jgi:hypothetical protein
MFDTMSIDPSYNQRSVNNLKDEVNLILNYVNMSPIENTKDADIALGKIEDALTGLARLVGIVLVIPSDVTDLCHRIDFVAFALLHERYGNKTNSTLDDVMGLMRKLFLKFESGV